MHLTKSFFAWIKAIFNDEKCFLFHHKGSFLSSDNFFAWLFGCMGKRLDKKNKTMLRSYRIAFRSVSQYYTVWREHTFLTFVLIMSLKTLSIILTCCDGKKNNHLKKILRKYSNTNNKKMLKESKIHLLWIDDAVASFITSTIQMQMSIWRSELGVDNMK